MVHLPAEVHVLHELVHQRLQLLTLLGEHERIRTRMAEDYRDVDSSLLPLERAKDLRGDQIRCRLAADHVPDMWRQYLPGLDPAAAA